MNLWVRAVIEFIFGLTRPKENGVKRIEVKIPLPSGYKVPQPPKDIEESRDTDLLHPEFNGRYQPLKKEFEKMTGWRLMETCTWRSTQKQGRLYKVGRRGVPGEDILTKIDGEKKRAIIMSGLLQQWMLPSWSRMETVGI